jgi:prepilin-type processing-associated H-X9-DG protein
MVTCPTHERLDQVAPSSYDIRDSLCWTSGRTPAMTTAAKRASLISRGSDGHPIGAVAAQVQDPGSIPMLLEDSMGYHDGSYQQYTGATMSESTTTSCHAVFCDGHAKYRKGSYGNLVADLWLRPL